MNKKLGNSHKGFTLVEILIVVGIIGLLASVVLSGLGSVRGRGRDARRVADLRQAQQGLELYYTKCGHYPGDSSCGDQAIQGDDTSWNLLRNALMDAGIGISSLASDPQCSVPDQCSTAQGNYNYASVDGQTYVLEAVLEDKNSSLLKDSFHNSYDSTNCATGPGTNGHYCIKF